MINLQESCDSGNYGWREQPMTCHGLLSRSAALSIYIRASATIFSYYYHPIQKMTTLPQTIDWDSSIPNYIEEDVDSITPLERENRARLDELVDKVHESHSWFSSCHRRGFG